MNETKRMNVAAYVAAERHLRADLRGAKTLTRWPPNSALPRAPWGAGFGAITWEVWMEHWAAVEEIWEAAQQGRDAKLSVHEVPCQVLLAELHRSLGELAADTGA